MITTAFASTLLVLVSSAQLMQRPAALNGRVRVTGGSETVPFATVRLLQLGSEIDRQVASIDGRFQFPDIAAGLYTVEVTYPGFQIASVQFDIVGPMRPEIDVELKPAVATRGPRSLVVSVYEAVVPKHARQEYERGRDERERQNCAKALPHLERAVQEFPRYASAHNELGSCYVESHDYDRAETAFKQSIEFGSSIYPYMNLADLYLKENRPDEAHATLESAIANHPQEGDLYYALANVYFVQGRLEQAEKAGLDADSRVHYVPDLHLLLAKIYLKRGNETAMRQQLELYLKEAPKSPLAPQIRDSLK